jgi:predicted site-specific integrase-resolvase
MKLLTDPTLTFIVVEHKDRLTCFGFNYIEQLLSLQGRKIEVIRLNNGVAENGKEDLVQDFVSIVTSFCARLYGQRRSKRKTERLIAELQAEEAHGQESPHPSQTQPSQRAQIAPTR